MTKDSDRTSSQADFLANLSVSQEKENLRKMTEISGRKLLGLSKSPDQLGLLEKMLVESLNSISTPFYRTWRVQTTPRGALIFQLRASVRTTKDKESGLLPTPRTGGGSRPNRKGGKVLEEEVMIEAGLRERGKTLAQMYPTPKASGYENAETVIKRLGMKAVKSHNLLAAVQMYPTPTARDYKDAGYQSTWKKSRDKSLPRTVLKNNKTGGRLNPNFVEYLMGFPTDWTRIEQTGSKDSETQSCRKSHTTSDKS